MGLQLFHSTTAKMSKKSLTWISIILVMYLSYVHHKFCWPHYMEIWSLHIYSSKYLFLAGKQSVLGVEQFKANSVYFNDDV